MNLVIELKNTIEKSLDSIAAAQDEAAAFERKWRGYYSDSVFDEKAAQVRAKCTEATETAYREIQRTADAFRAEIAEKFRLKGDELTADATLLESPVKLNQRDLTYMFDQAKEAKNHTMMELVQRRAARDGIIIERPYFREQDCMDAVSVMEKYARSALTSPGYAALWMDAETRGKITPAALHDWNNTEAPYSYNTTSR